jgi:hypothetical protein
LRQRAPRGVKASGFATVDALAVPVIHNFTAGSLDARAPPKVVASRHMEECI